MAVSIILYHVCCLVLKAPITIRDEGSGCDRNDGAHRVRAVHVAVARDRVPAEPVRAVVVEVARRQRPRPRACMNDADFYWTIEEIVCFAYAMENMPNNSDPFAGILNGSNSSYSLE